MEKKSLLSSYPLLGGRDGLEGKFSSLPFPWSTLLHGQADARAGSEEMVEDESEASLWAVFT